MQKEKGRRGEKEKEKQRYKIKIAIKRGKYAQSVDMWDGTILLTKQILNFRNPQLSHPPTLLTSPTTPQISQGWLQNLCKRYAVCHAYASRESSSHDAAHSICLTRDLNQLKIDLWIFLVYATRGGRRGVTLKRLLRCCVACQVQISKIDWNSTCSMRGVLVKPLQNYSFQFSARIVINFRKTYIYRFHKVAIHAQLS